MVDGRSPSAMANVDVDVTVDVLLATGEVIKGPVAAIGPISVAKEVIEGSPAHK